MVVITISYSPHDQQRQTHHGHRFDSSNHSLTSSTSISPTLTDSSSEPFSTSVFQVASPQGDVLATSKQEEWITKKKTELVTTKQIETRVKRQLVLEDGKVVEDSGPLVTTTTTEDTDKNESEQTEHKEHGGEGEPGEGWVAITNVPEDAIVKEMNERKVTTHDEVEDILETEEIKHLGDVSSEKLVRAIVEGSGNARNVFLRSDRNEMVALTPYDRDLAAQRRILQQSRRHDRTTDIEDTKEVSKFNEKGNMVTEITKRHEHEDFHNEDIPDSDSDEFDHLEEQEGAHDYSHAKNENYVEYLSIPKGGSLSQGVKIGEGARLISENISSQRQGEEDLWDSVSERIRKSQVENRTDQENNRVGGVSRSDALTSRPLDFSQEEHTRKNETNRWLSSHFGSSSSSLNSEPPPPRSPILQSPQGIHVTMTSRTSPVLISPPPPPQPPPPPMPPKTGKRITFQDTPSSSPVQKDVKFDLRNRHDSVMRSLNSQFGRATVTKSGEDLWDESSTPTPPPRSRRRNSPDIRNVRTPDQTSSPSQGNMYLRKVDQEPYSLQRISDTGERKSFERREESFGYTGSSQPLKRDSFEGTNFGDGYVTKHNNYYKTSETNNPAQNVLYENGLAEVTERKTLERREQNLTYDGPSQKQFHPKYILGLPNTTIGRLKGIEGTGALVTKESNPEQPSRHSQTLPRRRFYFGDDEGSLGNQHLPLEPKRSGGYGKPKELRHSGTDDINVSISSNYNTPSPDMRKMASLSRSMSFTPSTLREQTIKFSNRAAADLIRQDQRQEYAYKSNPHLLDSPDLLSPRLITNIGRSPREVNGHYDSLWTRNEPKSIETGVYSNRYESGNSNYSRSRTSHLDNVKKTNSDFYEPRNKGSSPSRSMTPTRAYSPINRAVATRSPAGGRTTDGYEETHRMTSSTPDNDVSKPRITTDTTSKFSRKTLRNDDGQPAGKVESSETTTRTKSRFKESEVMYPNGRREESPLSSFRPELRAQRSSGGGVVIPVRDPNNNRHVHYAK